MSKNKSILSRLKKKLNGSAKSSPADNKNKQKPLTILLLTNRSSDNVGDHAIEACDISLIRAAMKNLGVAEDGYRITSRDASIIPKGYVASRDPKLLERAKKLIADSDVVMFGGAPLINYKYQIFYERTATTIEIAHSLGKPVFFSSIGIESYDEDDPKCQRVKETLNLENVKRITTRDGYEFLEKYKERPDLTIGKTADPVVFAKWVFRKLTRKKNDTGKKKVGIFMIRHNAFTDNRIDFNWRQAEVMWNGIAKELESRGYDYEFLTSGHFADEAMLCDFSADYDLASSRFILNINFLEDLIGSLSGYDAVISCRLHPSILSYAFGIPSVGIIWNPKVKGFYDSFGYQDRTVPVQEVNPEKIADMIDLAINEGVNYDRDYCMSVYENIYLGLSETLGIRPAGSMYTFDELTQELPAYPGTDEKEKKAKIRRKFRRVYQNYNNLFRIAEEAK